MGTYKLLVLIVLFILFQPLPLPHHKSTLTHHPIHNTVLAYTAQHCPTFPTTAWCSTTGNYTTYELARQEKELSLQRTQESVDRQRKNMEESIRRMQARPDQIRMMN